MSDAHDMLVKFMAGDTSMLPCTICGEARCECWTKCREHGCILVLSKRGRSATILLIALATHDQPPSHYPRPREGAFSSKGCCGGDGRYPPR